MDMTSQRLGQTREAFDLGVFRVDPQRNTIAGPSGETVIEPKIMAVLLMLVTRAGEVITREEFIDSIWSEEYSGDESLTRAISHLRRELGDTRGVHTHIETVPKTGYRLIVHPRPASAGAKRGNLRRLLWAGTAVVLAAALSSIFVVNWMKEEPPEKAAAGQGPVVLAVLPFDSQSSATEDVFRARGLADEILSELSKSPSISVIAGNSSFRFRGDDDQDLKALARESGFSHIVDGSVRRSTGSLRVSVHLIDVATGLVVWSDVLNRPESEIYLIPKIAAAAIQNALGVDPIETGTRIAPPDPLAYETYLQALALLRARSDWPLERAIKYLEAVVEKDPSLSEAWATLAIARLNIIVTQDRPETGDPGFRNVDPPARLQAARREANAALAIDPGSIDAMLALAIIDYRERANTLAETERRFRSLLDMAPNHLNVNLRMGMVMMEVGRARESLRYWKKAHDLDPLSTLAGTLYAEALIHVGHVEEANALIDEGIYDGFERSYVRLTMFLLENDFQGARDLFTGLEDNVVVWRSGLTEAADADHDRPDTARMSRLLNRLVTVAELGDSAVDREIASDLTRAADEGLILHYFAFQLLAAAGLNDAAFDLARERIALDDAFFRTVLFKPAFRAGRHDPRVMELFEATTQLDYWLQTGKWPDFCAEPELPYDCEEAARRFRERL
jgi:TolB-like protein/DNA-binding winged helix-turn-helix (wHTH) protein/Tfp pilus assembly protein PilF